MVIGDDSCQVKVSVGRSPIASRRWLWKRTARWGCQMSSTRGCCVRIGKTRARSKRQVATSQGLWLLRTCSRSPRSPWSKGYTGWSSPTAKIMAWSRRQVAASRGPYLEEVAARTRRRVAVCQRPTAAGGKGIHLAVRCRPIDTRPGRRVVAPGTIIVRHRGKVGFRRLVKVPSGYLPRSSGCNVLILDVPDLRYTSKKPGQGVACSPAMSYCNIQLQLTVASMEGGAPRCRPRGHCTAPTLMVI